MNVLVIPEDFRKDQYILKPILSRMLAEIGLPRAKLEICIDPLLGGVQEALKFERIEEIIDMYRGMVDLFLLVVDRDGIEGRRTALDRIERLAAEALNGRRTLIAEHAWQEIEVWALAGLRLTNEWNWREVRSDIHPKERYFDPLARQRGLTSEPGQGRRTLGREAAANYRRVRSRCPEDVRAMETRIEDWRRSRGS